jgi:hypothetical protein
VTVVSYERFIAVRERRKLVAAVLAQLRADMSIDDAVVDLPTDTDDEGVDDDECGTGSVVAAGAADPRLGRENRLSRSRLRSVDNRHGDDR